MDFEMLFSCEQGKSKFVQVGVAQYCTISGVERERLLSNTIIELM